MSKIRLHGSSSGYTEIAPVAASGNNTLTLPNDGTIISKDANGAVGVTSVVTTTATITTAKVGAAVTISESGIEASGIGITCANINGTQIGGRRNIIINGAMLVAQRGTSSTSTGYQTVDRYQAGWNGGGVTQSQADVGSSDTPYTLGFRKTLKLTNTSTATGAADYRDIRYYVEAQDIANSGWDLSSSSSNITLSFWVKASVAQTYYFFIYVPDSSKHYTTSFALSADTWTKVIKKIPGASGLSVNNDNGNGLNIQIAPFYGTNFTTSGQAVDTWGTWSGSSRVPDMTNTWANTSNSTFEITGLQLEVGTQATPFEHRSHAEELSLCQRYFQILKGGFNVAAATSIMVFSAPLYCVMRATPSAGKINLSGSNSKFEFGDMVSVADHSVSTPTFDGGYIHQDLMVTGSIAGFDNLTAYRSYKHEPNTTNGALITADAEL